MVFARRDSQPGTVEIGERRVIIVTSFAGCRRREPKARYNYRKINRLSLSHSSAAGLRECPDLARLVALRRKADMRADRPGMEETLRLVDRRTVGQRYHCADPWGGHQPPAHRVAADHAEQHLVQDGELLAHDPADAEQRLDDRGQPGEAFNELAHPRLVSKAADHALCVPVMPSERSADGDRRAK